MNISFKAAGLLLSGVALLLAPALRASELRLTEDGQPKAIIVVAEPLRPTDLATKILVSHIKQISGATIPVMLERQLGEMRVENGRLTPADAKAAAESYILLG